MKPRLSRSGTLNRRSLLRRTVALLAAGAPATVRSEEDVRPPRFLLEWGQQGKAEGELDSPIGIAVDRQDRIYVSDFKNGRVQTFTAEGRFLGAFPVAAPQAGGLAVGADGCIYVAHWNQNRIIVYSQTGEVLREWGKMGTGDGEFRLPGGPAIARDGSIYVPDQGNSRIQKFTPSGELLMKWGERGAGPGQFGAGREPGSRFAGPQFLALDREGDLYATQVFPPRVQKFAPDGRSLLMFGTGQPGPGGFGGVGQVEGPIGVCVDRSGNVWVSGTNHRVQQWSSAGRFLQSLGREGSGPGEFHYPHGLAVDSRNRLYVVDTQNHRIQKFQLGV